MQVRSLHLSKNVPLFCSRQIIAMIRTNLETRTFLIDPMASTYQVISCSDCNLMAALFTIRNQPFSVQVVQNTIVFYRLNLVDSHSIDVLKLGVPQSTQLSDTNVRLMSLSFYAWLQKYTKSKKLSKQQQRSIWGYF